MEPIAEGSQGILVETLLEGMAEYYSAELSEKVIRGQTENALKGKCTGGTGTIGYKMKAIEDGLYTRTTKERLEALEIQKDELTAKIADEKLKKPSFNEDFIRFWLMKFRKFDISQKKQRKALIEIFVNAIFLYDDRILITFNYKDGTQTVRFEDTLTADSAEEKSSDLSSLAGP